MDRPARFLGLGAITLGGTTLGLTQKTVKDIDQMHITLDELETNNSNQADVIKLEVSKQLKTVDLEQLYTEGSKIITTTEPITIETGMVINDDTGQSSVEMGGNFGMFRVAGGFQMFSIGGLDDIILSSKRITIQGGGNMGPSASSLVFKDGYIELVQGGGITTNEQLVDKQYVDNSTPIVTSFVPVMSATGGAFFIVNSSVFAYVIRGKLINFTCSISFTKTSSSTNTVLITMPHNVLATTTFNIGVFSGSLWTGEITCDIIGNTNQFQFNISNKFGATPFSLKADDFAGSGNFTISGSYIIS